MSLADLVQGYEQGQQLQMKKAQEVARKQSEQFQQQFELSQAKQKAAYEQQQVGLEQQRIGIEKTAAESNAQAKRDKAEHDKALEAIQSFRATATARYYEGKLNFGDKKTMLTMVNKDIADLVKQGVPEYQARNAVYEHMDDMERHIVGGMPLMGSMGQSQPQGQGQPLDPRILQSLSGAASMMGGAPPAAAPQPGQQGQPAAGLHTLPGAGGESAIANQSVPPLVAAQIAAAAQKQKQSQAQTDLAQARATQIKALTAADLLVKQATAGLSQARKKEIDQKVAFKAKTEGVDISKKVADLALTQAHTKKLLADIPLERLREDRLRLKAAFDARRATNTDRKDALRNMKEAVTERDKMGNEVMNVVQEIATIDKSLQDPKTPVQTKRLYESLKLGYAADLQEKLGVQQHIIQEYEAAAKQVADQGIIEPTAASGGPAPSRAKANRDAIHQDARRAGRPGPTVEPVNPLLQQGLELQRRARANGAYDPATTVHRPGSQHKTAPAGTKKAKKSGNDPLGIR